MCNASQQNCVFIFPIFFISNGRSILPPCIIFTKKTYKDIETVGKCGILMKFITRKTQRAPRVVLHVARN